MIEAGIFFFLKFRNLLGGCDTFDLKVPRVGGQNCIREQVAPVPDCAGEEGAASVVRAAAEALLLEAVAC